MRASHSALRRSVSRRLFPAACFAVHFFLDFVESAIQGGEIRVWFCFCKGGINIILFLVEGFHACFTFCNNDLLRFFQLAYFIADHCLFTLALFAIDWLNIACWNTLFCRRRCNSGIGVLLLRHFPGVPFHHSTSALQPIYAGNIHNYRSIA